MHSTPRRDFVATADSAPSQNNTIVEEAKEGSWTQRISDTFMHVIIPSSSKAFRDQQQQLIDEGMVKLKPFRSELNNLKAIRKHYVYQRREASDNLAQCIGTESHGVMDPDVLDGLMSTYRKQAAICVHLEDQISKLENVIDTITESCATELCLNLTGYRGLKDWANDTWAAYSDLVQTISAVCFVGAGLTYATIFSATRGDLGLMSWAFSLFIVGMIITVTVQAFLMQCARLEEYPFSTQRQWEIFVSVAVYSSCLAVIVAISLLLVTVLELQTSNMNDLTLKFSLRPPAIFALSAIGIGIMVVLVVIGVFLLANGVKVLLWRRRLLRNKLNEKNRKLDEHLMGL